MKQAPNTPVRAAASQLTHPLTRGPSHARTPSRHCSRTSPYSSFPSSVLPSSVPALRESAAGLSVLACVRLIATRLHLSENIETAAPHAHTRPPRSLHPLRAPSLIRPLCSPCGQAVTNHRPSATPDDLPRCPVDPPVRTHSHIPTHTAPPTPRPIR